MRRFLGIFAICVSVIGLVGLPSASAQGTLSQGDWTLAYPDFSNYASDASWKFELRANGSNYIAQNDYIKIEVFTTNNVSIAIGTNIHSGANTKSIPFDLTIFKFNLNKSNFSTGLVAKVSIDRGFSSGLADTTFSFNVPTTTFPKRPSSISDYVSVSTDFSKPIEFPKECSDVLFTYTIKDPYRDLSEINFDVVDSSGKSIASTYAFSSKTEPVQGELRLCPYSIDPSKAPFNFQIELKFVSSLNLAPLVSQIPFNLKGKYSAIEELIAGMPTVCQKGSSYKSAKGGCPSGFKPVSFQAPTTIQWNTLTRSAGSLKGKKFLVYGCVAQFDTNTGGSKFRAYTLPAPADRYYNGANSLYTGSAKALLKLSENDAFAAKVSVSGATTYTTLGGRTSVPTFAIRDYIKIGKC
ncbi:MAG: hypothetical protein RLZZ159_1177 [Actinomycetota bacterium]|jgi:hypothetical protein